jgi:hypothetical protein
MRDERETLPLCSLTVLRKKKRLPPGDVGAARRIQGDAIAPPWIKKKIITFKNRKIEASKIPKCI